MKKHGNIVLACLGMLCMVLDTQTAILSIRSGITLCLETVIPSLFVLVLISQIVSTRFQEIPSHFLRPLRVILKLPNSAEPIFLIGIMSGYPIGAQAIGESVAHKQLSSEDGKRMMAFCCTAGPAFIFGMGANLFTDWWQSWIVWILVLSSCCIVARIFPSSASINVVTREIKPISFITALNNTIHTMANISAWVVVFRVIIGYLQRWFLWHFPTSANAMVLGFLELSNGTCELMTVEPAGLRLTLFAAMLSFGGLCVACQSYSVCGNVDPHLYIPGKILQCAITMMLSQPAQLLFSESERYFLPLPYLSIPMILIIIVVLRCIKHRNRTSISLPHGV